VKLASARVVRDGGGPGHASAVAAPDNVRRLAARKLPRGITWRLLFGGELGASGWFCVLFGHVFALFLIPGEPLPERRFMLLGMSAYGLVYILLQLRSGRRTLRLLRRGVPSWGRIVAQVKAPVVGRSGPPIVSTLEYPIENGTSRWIQIRTARGEFADGESCWVLYDAAEPRHATVLHRAPGAPTLVRDEDQIVLQRRLYGWTALILPLATVVTAAMAAGWLR